MKKTVYFTKRSRKKAVLEALKETFELVKKGKMDSRRFQFLLAQIKQFKKFEDDNTIKQIEKEFLEWKRENKNE